MKENLIMFLATIAIIAIIIVYSLHIGRKLETAEQWEKSVDHYVDQSEKSWLIGWDLETGLNNYPKSMEPINEQVQNATRNNPGNRFDADSVRRNAALIAGGEAARKRGN